MGPRDLAWWVAIVAAACMSAAIIVIGARFLLAPESGAEGFGLPSEAGPFLTAKGIRDIGTGLVGAVLLTTRRFRAAGWALIALAWIPLGDAVVVLAWDGSEILAYAMHGGTAAAMIVVGTILVRGRARDRSPSTARETSVDAEG
ncbi:DUF4267 domain-containing protein [Nocardiopsis alba]|uniref:DUF4267 domain-containing protein n=1 Tax=Nocardiopsis alba TaxID=53437 RepID=UPI0033D33832